MKILAIIPLVIGLSAGPACALPPAATDTLEESPAAAMAAATAPSADQDAHRAAGHDAEIDLDGFIRLANIIGHDDRNSVDHFGGAVTPAERRQLAQVTGWVECAPSATFPGTSGSASLVGSNAKIVTVAHNFFDEQRHLPNPLPRCFFRTKAHPHRRIPLVFEPGTYKIGATFFDASRDYAIVRLAEPVRGVTPLSFGPAPSAGSQIILISAQANFARKPIDTSQPVARLCTVHKTFSPIGNANTFFRGDCDTSAGDSGGIYLARYGGHLVAVGLHHGGGLPQANGLAYDDTAWDTSRKSYSLGIAFGPAVLNDFRAVH